MSVMLLLDANPLAVTSLSLLANDPEFADMMIGAAIFAAIAISGLLTINWLRKRYGRKEDASSSDERRRSMARALNAAIREGDIAVRRRAAAALERLQATKGAPPPGLLAGLDLNSPDDMPSPVAPPAPVVDAEPTRTATPDMVNDPGAEPASGGDAK
jgi:hypothetical protein